MTTPSLSQFSFFFAFTESQLQQVEAQIKRVTFAAGAVIFYEGDTSEQLYLIISGMVRIYRADAQGATVELTQLKDGQAFGELAMLSGEVRMATAQALTDCECFVVGRPVLLSLLGFAKPEQIAHLFRLISGQMRESYNRDFHTLLEQRTLESRMEAQRQSSLTQLVAGVAHEINTPLGIIATAASILKREFERPPVQALKNDKAGKRVFDDMVESLGLIEGNIARAHKLVQNFKKVSVSQLVDDREEMNLLEALQDVISLSNVNLKYSGVRVQFDHALAADEQLWTGYRGYLAQIILNLLTNIERYAYPGKLGGVAEITVAQGEKDTFVLMVRDFGKGMSEEVATHIFEPFFTTGRGIGGTGLGMTIVYNLVTTALHGTIAVQSALGMGTTFTITFPRVVP